MGVLRKVVNRARARYYSLFYEIGKGCSFGKIRFSEHIRGTIFIGNKVAIFRKTELCSKKHMPIIIGNGSFINQQCIIRPNVTIGNNVSIGQRVNIISDSHEIGISEKRAGKPIFQPIVIKDGCWIGANSTILGNVTIGEGTIIAAGSVVNKNCEPNSLYGGVPAKFIKKLN